ncbi:hypothetical protein, partial [Paraburkholderia phenoliruptrix]|uniref:hypothetical protein n=1 Tax=Paraburkholderia phenoliruptrix TaxID=252970 RepID=UPI001ABB764E
RGIPPTQFVEQEVNASQHRTERSVVLLDRVSTPAHESDAVTVLRPGLFEDRRGMFVSRTSGTNF